MYVSDDAPIKHEEEDENYFISMTDMMVGILFIFIIMLMLFALNLREQTDESSERIEKLKKASEVARQVAVKLDDLRDNVHSEINTINKANKERAQLLNEIKIQLQKEGLEVQVDDINGVLRLTEDAIRFPVNGALLSNNAKTNVGKVAHVLQRVLPAYTSCILSLGTLQCKENTSGAKIETVFVEGHTDSTGIDELNWSLSTGRAVNTYREITKISPELRTLRNRTGNEIISVSGYSSTRPIDARSNSLAYAANRRIDLRFVMEVDNRKRLQQILSLTDRMKGELQSLRQAVEQTR